MTAGRISAGTVPTDFAGEVVLFYFPEHSIAEKREKYKETAFCVIIPVHYEQVMNCDTAVSENSVSFAVAFSFVIAHLVFYL